MISLRFLFVRFVIECEPAVGIGNRTLSERHFEKVSISPFHSVTINGIVCNRLWGIHPMRVSRISPRHECPGWRSGDRALLPMTPALMEQHVRPAVTVAELPRRPRTTGRRRFVRADIPDAATAIFRHDPFCAANSLQAPKTEAQKPTSRRSSVPGRWWER